MGAIEKDRHRPWLAYALEESLGRSLLAPRDVIDFANPEVLVTQLPHAVITDLLSRALVVGTFSPAQVLESAPPAVLAEHLDPDVMWRCLKEAADRGGLSKKVGVRSAPARQWFASVVARALETELITPADVVRFLPPAEFVVESPKPVLVELIKAALARASFDPALVLQHITPAVIADHLETSLVWACIVEAATRHFELAAPSGKADEPGAAAKASFGPAATNPVKPGAKPIERDKAAIDRRAAAILADRGSPSVPMGTGAAAAARRTESPAPRTTATLPAAVPAAPAARNDAGEWSVGEDLDVLDDQPLPFPLPR